MRWLIAGLAVALALFVALAMLFLLVVNPPLFFRLLAAGGVLLTVLSVAAMLRSARRATAVSIKAQILSMAISLLSVVVFAFLLGARLGPLVSIFALLLGGMVGTVWCFTTRLRLEDGVVRRHGSLLYLAFWALVFVAQQALAVVLGRVPAVGMGLLLFGTGIVLGQCATLVARTALLRSTAR